MLIVLRTQVPHLNVWSILLLESIMRIYFCPESLLPTESPMTDTNSHNRSVEILYQLNPEQESLHPYSKSKTESIASFLRAARHEAGRLLVNGTEPNHIIQLNYQTELHVKEIKELWQKHSRRLRSAGIVAHATIEITKYKRTQWATNKVHYHFVVKDDRTPDELEELFEGLWLCV